MVDDESKPERRPTKHMQTPEQWQNPFNPAYSYWAYYVWANLTVLNRFRESKGYTTLTFRPHSGEVRSSNRGSALQTVKSLLHFTGTAFLVWGSIEVFSS